jgi:Fe-Mn family superoxide dismutase
MPVSPLTSRREVLGAALAGAAVTVLASHTLPAFAGDAPAGTPGPTPAAAPTGPLVLAPLPYADTALAPVISQNTLSFHYGKHHKTYVEKGNAALAGNPLADKPIPDIIRATAGKPDQAAIYNNVAQAWNHDFYWRSMKPGGGGAPTGRVADLLKTSWGGLDGFKGAFAKAAAGRFGSGWVWLVSNKGKVEILDTANADTPLPLGLTPLLVADVWEHAYYLDYQNRRADYIAAWMDKLIDWSFVEKNLG